MASSTISREHAEHFCPWKPKADATTAVAASSRFFQSRSTMMASLPPISATTRLIQSWPGRDLAASSLMCRPTSFEPVNEMKRRRVLITSGSPTSAPEPLRKLTTPAGMPASSSNAKKRQAIHGASDDGLSTTQLPVTTAADVMPAMMARGKFHGGITPPTPRGT